MKRLLLDCSVTISWFFEDEMSNYSAKILANISAKKVKPIVPAIWELEVTNVLLSKIRRKYLSFAQAANILASVDDLGIEVIATTKKHNLEIVFPLAHEEKLTSYDASYLQLALAENAQLASLDTQLVEAAKRVGVPLYA